MSTRLAIGAVGLLAGLAAATQRRNHGSRQQIPASLEGRMSASSLVKALAEGAPQPREYATNYSPEAIQMEMLDGMEGPGGSPEDWEWEFRLMDPWAIRMDVDQPASMEDAEQLRAKIRDGAPLPPITVQRGESYDWDGEVEIANGRHRLWAARRQGVSLVPVLVTG